MSIKLTYKEWKALRDYFRYEESVLRDSYGVPGKKEQTFRKLYAEAQPTAAMLYEAARQVFGKQP